MQRAFSTFDDNGMLESGGLKRRASLFVRSVRGDCDVVETAATRPVSVGSFSAETTASSLAGDADGASKRRLAASGPPRSAFRPIVRSASAGVDMCR